MTPTHMLKHQFVHQWLTNIMARNQKQRTMSVQTNQLQASSKSNHVSQTQQAWSHSSSVQKKPQLVKWSTYLVWEHQYLSDSISSVIQASFLLLMVPHQLQTTEVPFIVYLQLPPSLLGLWCVPVPWPLCCMVPHSGWVPCFKTPPCPLYPPGRCSIPRLHPQHSHPWHPTLCPQWSGLPFRTPSQWPQTQALQCQQERSPQNRLHPWWRSLTTVPGGTGHCHTHCRRGMARCTMNAISA